MLTHPLLCCALIALSSQNVSVPWHHPLSLDGGGYWAARIPLIVQNTALFTDSWKSDGMCCGQSITSWQP